jgi:shikimate kinase
MENNTPKKFIILLHGPMGSGKTTTSKRLHEVIVPSARVALPDMRRLISGNHREHGEITRNVMLDMTRSYLGQNIPVIVETVCGEGYIKEYADIALKNGCLFLAYHINAEESIRWNRVCERTRLMMGLPELPLEKEEELKPIFAENKAFYDKQEGNIGSLLDTSDLITDEVISKILSDLNYGN